MSCTSTLSQREVFFFEHIFAQVISVITRVAMWLRAVARLLNWAADRNLTREELDDMLVLQLCAGAAGARNATIFIVYLRQWWQGS